MRSIPCGQSCARAGHFTHAAIWPPTASASARAGAVDTLLAGKGHVMITRQNGRIVPIPFDELIDPATGKEHWFCRGFNGRGTPIPAYGHGLLYVISGNVLTAVLRMVGVTPAAAPALISLLWGLLAVHRGAIGHTLRPVLVGSGVLAIAALIGVFYLLVPYAVLGLDWLFTAQTSPTRGFTVLPKSE